MTSGPVLTGDRGSVLLLVLIFMMLLTALGTGLVAVATTERLAADNYRAGVEAGYAAGAAAAFVRRELSTRPEWTSAICCNNRSQLVDGTRTPVLPSGTSIDLDRETARLQARTDAESGVFVSREQWRCFAWGPLERLAGATPHHALPYVVVWIADDRAEIDNDPLTDANGVVVVRAQALGARGSSRTVEQVLRRDGAAGVELVAWREVP